MKARVLSSLVGLVLLAAIILLFNTPVLNAAIMIISLIAVIELLMATKLIRFRGLTVLAILLALIIPLVRWSMLRPILVQLFFVIILLFFLLLIKNHAVMQIRHVAMVFFFSTIIPIFFSCAVYMRDDVGAVAGCFAFIVAVGSAWLCDTGAFFTGRSLGKTKLAPNISPKKTVEGAVGGVIVSALMMLVLGFLYSLALAELGYPVRINYLALGLTTPVFAVIGMLGDLSASVIKREYGVKDFGKIMPGHGGIMDRFDSVLFTLPTVFIVLQHVVLIEVL